MQRSKEGNMKLNHIGKVVLILALLLCAWPNGSAEASDITVDTVSDDLDAAGGDCLSVSSASLPGPDGFTSLREAICAANHESGADNIYFDIPAEECDDVTGVCTITPLSGLPTLTDSYTLIDGYSQTGAQEATGLDPAILMIEINGSSTTDEYGLLITSSRIMVQGLVINRFDYAGVCLRGEEAVGNMIQGNYLGTDPSGATALGNDNGVLLHQGAHQNWIGGNATDARNIISGNYSEGVLIRDVGTDGNTIMGNYIGLDADGVSDLGNGLAGVAIRYGSQQNTIGGDTSGERNLISGNDSEGVFITSSGTISNTVSGNYIGTDVSGTLDLGNSADGIRIYSGAQHNVIGGDTPGERNVISGNGYAGVHIYFSGADNNQVIGNYIGTVESGRSGLGNDSSGVRISGGAQMNFIGGDQAGEGNLISGNSSNGVLIDGGNTISNTVSANFIGVDASGEVDLPNSHSGVQITGGAQSNTVGGTSAQERNIISGNGQHGIDLSASDNNLMIGNYIGVDVDGNTCLGNSLRGIQVYNGSDNNIIGGSTPAERNVIACNSGRGVWFGGSDESGNLMLGNFIGVGADAMTPLGNNGGGVYVSGSAHDNTLGPGNLIAHNLGEGIVVDGFNAIRNLITQNSIFFNTIGIDLKNTANGGIAAPVISGVAPPVGDLVTVEGTACAGCTVEVFSNSDADGEGETYLGSAVTNGSGDFSLPVSLLVVLSKPHLTATATDAALGTSEFSSVYSLDLYPIYLPLIFNNP